MDGAPVFGAPADDEEEPQVRLRKRLKAHRHTSYEIEGMLDLVTLTACSARNCRQLVARKLGDRSIVRSRILGSNFRQLVARKFGASLDFVII